MSSSIFEIGQVLLAVAVFGYIFYLLAFSRDDSSKRERPREARHGFERRDFERVERRHDKNPAPPNGVERRKEKARGRRQID